MEKKDFFAAIYNQLSAKLSGLEIVILSENEYPQSMDLIILSNTFENMHEVDVSEYLLSEFKSAFGSNFYNGIYSFKGMTRSNFNKNFGSNKGRLYSPNRSESNFKIGASEAKA